MDPSRADRWHRRPVPRLGGVAIFAAFLATVSVFLPRLGLWPPPGGVAAALAGMAVIFLVGLADDVRGLENR